MADKTIKLEQLSYFYGKLKGIFVQKDGSKVLSDNNYSNAEKAKLAAIAENANNYTLPVATDKALGGVKVGTGINKAEDGTISVTPVDISGKANTADVVLKTQVGTAVNETGALDTQLPSEKAVVTYVSGKVNGINEQLKNYAVKADIASAVNYKGSVDAFANLPAAEKAKVGDMYNVQTAGGNAGDGTEIKAGDNVVWNGTAWDNMGGTFVINYATQDDIDAIFTASSDEK